MNSKTFLLWLVIIAPFSRLGSWLCQCQCQWPFILFNQLGFNICKIFLMFSDLVINWFGVSALFSGWRFFSEVNTYGCFYWTDFPIVIRENTGQRKPVFSHILSSEYFFPRKTINSESYSENSEESFLTAVGWNIAMTQNKVHFQNELFSLILITTLTFYFALLFWFPNDTTTNYLPLIVNSNNKSNCNEL